MTKGRGEINENLEEEEEEEVRGDAGRMGGRIRVVSGNFCVSL